MSDLKRGEGVLYEDAANMTDKPRKVTTVGGIERHPTLQSGLLDTDERLSVCPFCGATAGLREQYQMLRAECSNTSCGVATPYHYRTRELAIEAWNRRAALVGKVKGELGA
jgi:hypothetical protein